MSILYRNVRDARFVLKTKTLAGCIFMHSNGVTFLWTLTNLRMKYFLTSQGLLKNWAKILYLLVFRFQNYVLSDMFIFRFESCFFECVCFYFSGLNLMFYRMCLPSTTNTRIRNAWIIKRKSFDANTKGVFK